MFRRLFIYSILIGCFFIEVADCPAAEGVPDTSSEVFAEELQIPSFQRVRPQWGVEVASTLNAFGGTALTAEQGTTPFYALSLHMEYQPAFLQTFGVLGFGPSFAVYPAIGSVTPTRFSVLSAGGQVRYQARYFREQLIVPVVGYGLEYIRYEFNSGFAGNALLSGPSLGLWLLLNGIEGSSAYQMYMSTGITRSYLIFEWRNLEGQTANLTVTGASYYFGLRVEF